MLQAFRGQVRVQAVHDGDDFLRRQRLANDAGGGEEDLVRGHAERGGGGFGGGLHGTLAGGAGEDVGVAGVDDQAARQAAP